MQIINKNNNKKAIILTTITKQFGRFFPADLYTSIDRYDLTSSLRSSFVSLEFASQLRHTDTSLAIKADASYKMPNIGSHKVTLLRIIYFKTID